MPTTRVGTSKQYADNWETIFGGKRWPAPSGAAPKESTKKGTAQGAKSAKKKTSKLPVKKRPAAKKSRR